MMTVKKANEQIRRLRAGLQEARDTLRDHFGPDDASVKACDVALAGELILPGHAGAIPLTVEQVRAIENGGLIQTSIGYRMPDDVWHTSDPTRNTWPEAVQADTRVDVRFERGGTSEGRFAWQWAWGDAGSMTITDWRLSK